MRFILVSIFMLFLTCEKQNATTDSSVAASSSEEQSKTSIPKVSVTEKATIDNNSSLNEKSVVNNKKSESVIEKPSSIDENISKAKEVIPFEEVNHYFFSLIKQNYLLINDQAKMDEVFSIIHRQNGGTRLAPIPTIMDDSTYLIFKPAVKTSNDVEIKEVYLRDNILYVEVKPLVNPDIKTSSRIASNVLLKLLKKVSNKKVTVKYL